MTIGHLVNHLQTYMPHGRYGENVVAYNLQHIASEARIVVYSDDLAVIVVAKDLTIVELQSNKAITTIKKRLENAGLALAEDKTEAVLITKWR